MRTEPTTISMAFGIEATRILAAGAIDVSLNCDTNLFIDPLLLSDSSDRDFAACAADVYKQRFETIIELLGQSTQTGDYAWRNAERLFEFPEIRYTHLGYSGGRGGSGSGSKIRASLMDSCREAIRLGIKNPNLFLVLALFEQNVGADRISDMVTGIVQSCLCAFTMRVATDLGIRCETFQLKGGQYDLPRNPVAPSREPVIFVPHDVVRDLPMAADWESVAAAAKETTDLREKVSKHIGEIWAAKTRQDKDNIKSILLSGRERFEQFLELFEWSAGEPYNIREDHLGEIYPADLRRKIAKDSPLDLSGFACRLLGPDEVAEIVRHIIGKYQTLLESNGLWELLYDEDRETPRRERAAQRLFFAIAAAYCETNNLDLSPEADSGCGPVDFKVSQGAKSKVIVEIKKSTNNKLIDGFVTQLGTYELAERPYASHYVVLDVGHFTTEKRRRLRELDDEAVKKNDGKSKLWIIDASPKVSASHR